MNQIVLIGKMGEIKRSHTINDIDYSSALVTVKNSNGKESVLNVVYKQFQNTLYKEGDDIALQGNVRTFSKKGDDGSNKTNVYVYTYLDKVPEEVIEGIGEGVFNYADISGRICKMGELRKMANDKCNVLFILANNIQKGDKYVSSYIPCVAWGKLAKQIAKMEVGDKIEVLGELRSREYIKTLSDNVQQIRVAHEVLVTDVVEREEEE